MNEPESAGPPPAPDTPVPGSQGDRRALIFAAVALGVAAVIALVVVVFVRPTTSGSPSPAPPVAAASNTTTADVPPSDASGSQAPPSQETTPSSGPTVAGAPNGSTPCPVRYPPTGLYRASSVGTAVTSCGFAEEVRVAYARSGRPGQLPRSITARSPETGTDIDMLCAAQAKIVTCTGGANATVYLY